MGRIAVGDWVDSTGLIQMIVKGDVQGFTSSQQGLNGSWHFVDRLHKVEIWRWTFFLVCLFLYERCFSLIQTHRHNNNDTVKQVECRDTQSKWRQKSRMKKQTQLNWDVDPPNPPVVFIATIWTDVGTARFSQYRRTKRTLVFTVFTPNTIWMMWSCV